MNSASPPARGSKDAELTQPMKTYLTDSGTRNCGSHLLMGRGGVGRLVMYMGRRRRRRRLVVVHDVLQCNVKMTCLCVEKLALLCSEVP